MCIRDRLWRRDLPLSVRNRISAYIFGVGRTPAEKSMLASMFDLAGFQPSSNRQLKFVLDIEDFKQRSEVLLDPHISESRKSERLSDLRERYERLSRAVQPGPDGAR